MSEHTTETEQFGVESPEGAMWVYDDPRTAATVARERGKPVLRRAVTYSPWEMALSNPTEQETSDA